MGHDAERYRLWKYITSLVAARVEFLINFAFSPDEILLIVNIWSSLWVFFSICGVFMLPSILNYELWERESRFFFLRINHVYRGRVQVVSSTKVADCTAGFAAVSASGSTGKNSCLLTCADYAGWIRNANSAVMLNEDALVAALQVVKFSYIFLFRLATEI